MSKAVLISIHPEWCYKIIKHEKTIDVRKTCPKLKTPFKCYIYQTLPKSGDWNERDGRVIGEFICDRIYIVDCEHAQNLNEAFLGISCDDFLRQSCMTAFDLLDYLTAGDSDSREYKTGFGLHISDLVIYGTPKQLCDFSNSSSRLEFSDTEDGFPLRWSGMKRPPQSWCYVEALDEILL